MKRLRAAAFPLGVAVLLLAALVAAALSFAHPDMTPMRLLLTYWPVWAVAACGFLLMAWSMESWK